MYEALQGHINLVQASDLRLWAYMAHKQHWDYMHTRWKIDLPDDEDEMEENDTKKSSTDKTIDRIGTRYFFKASKGKAFVRHGIARLYWSVYLTYDENNENGNPYEYTEYFFSKQDIFTSITERSYARNKVLVLAALKELKKNSELSRTEVRAFLAKLNQAGAITVLDFLDNLAQRSKAQGQKELAELQAFCEKNYNITALEPWDIIFYSEKQKQHLYSISDEELRPYFPENQVISGLFELMKRIFNIRAVERFDVETWHKDVRFFDLIDETNEVRGSFYLDLYARENKRGGAWMDDCIGRKRKADGTIQKPVAYLTCNFNAPIGDKPALFTHDEVTTLFHEFGHGIHHMLTQIDVADVAGINGVPWDAVELPSQFLENWCWEEEALAFISGHYETGEPLPKEKLAQLLRAKNFQAAMFVLRQLEFGLFDFRLHHYFDASKQNQILDTLKQVKAEVAVIKGVDWARTPHSFNHIFAGGYSAGYYSYLWAEVLSADAYSRFEEEGIFNAETGRSFLDEILTRGGSEEPMTLFKRFRGREPQLDALLRHKGIATN